MPGWEQHVAAHLAHAVVVAARPVAVGDGSALFAVGGSQAGVYFPPIGSRNSPR